MGRVHKSFQMCYSCYSIFLNLFHVSLSFLVITSSYFIYYFCLPLINVFLHLICSIFSQTIAQTKIIVYNCVHVWGIYQLHFHEKNTVHRARNNFRIVSGHDDRPNSFLLGHVSFLAGQMYMMNYSFRGP